MPSVTEEAYLTSHPEARPARAFHVMCSEGDTEGILMMLSSLQETDGDESDLISLLCYQDPLTDDKSGLHLAVGNGKEEVVLLLVWLCSNVPSESFPQHAREMAEASGVGRLIVGPSQDVRSLQDTSGQTPGQLALHGQSAPLPGLISKLLFLDA